METKRLYVPLDRDVFVRLVERAESERRRPQDEAAVLLAQALAPVVEQSA